MHVLQIHNKFDDLYCTYYQNKFQAMVYQIPNIMILTIVVCFDQFLYIEVNQNLKLFFLSFRTKLISNGCF